jgi:2'-5' RNA ligase
MNQPLTKGEYHISIRITFPENIRTIIRKEKDRLSFLYVSKYKTEPHITLYLTRDVLGEYPIEAFSMLIHDLQKIEQRPFDITLLPPKIDKDMVRQRNFYVLGIDYNEQLEVLRKQIRNIAGGYQRSISSGLNNADIEPHITLAGIGFDLAQPDLAEIENNVQSVIGEHITISNIIVFFYIKESGEEKAKLLEKIVISF